MTRFTAALPALLCLAGEPPRVNPPPSVTYWIFQNSPWILVCFGLLILGIRWARLRRRTRPDAEELILGAVSHSLQERGQLAAVLGELQTVHQKLLDALPFGILWVDQRGRVAAVSAPGRALLGVKPGVVGLDAPFVLEPFPWLLEALSRAPGGDYRCDGNGRRWRLRRIEAPDNVGALLQFEDITEQEQEERRRQLRERFAELGEMTAGVAHQLKNGLAVLKGQGQLLQRSGHGEVARDLLMETDELERVVQRFLQWARPLEPHCVPQALEDIADQAIAEVQRRPVAQDLKLVREGEGVASADAMLLHQALVNLLENACQASQGKALGAERVLVRIADDRIEVLDEGTGFGEDTLIRMLRPFESGRPGGTGLGLPLALKWLNAQGADLTFEPRPEGGTRVVVQW